MELEVVSTHPRAFIVDRFLSDHETDEIIKLARPGMTESQVGKFTEILKKDYFFHFFFTFRLIFSCSSLSSEINYTHILFY